jgi:hypothetical protein
VNHAVPGSSVFPEGFLPSLDAADMPTFADTHDIGTPAATARYAARTRPVENAMRLPPVLAAGPPAALPPDAGGVIDGEARELAPPSVPMYRRRGAAIVLVLVLAVVVLVVGLVMRDDRTADTPTGTPAGSVLPAAAVPPDSVDKAPSAAGVAAAARGFTFAGGYGPVLGSAGTLRRFNVAVEKRDGPGDVGDFADQIDRILGDSRSWIADRQLRLQRVPSAAASEFTVYLASAGTSEKMCAAGGLKTEGFTSCRLPGQVIINSERWADAVPGYAAPVAVYRAYAINHEVGHQLGHGHESCAGAGAPAPVMMQQTYGLQGCVANSWPYLGGKRYAGNPID